MKKVSQSVVVASPLSYVIDQQTKLFIGWIIYKIKEWRINNLQENRLLELPGLLNSVVIIFVGKGENIILWIYVLGLILSSKYSLF
ncbi:MAG: hypothetical protein A4E52_01340 [Pelotomaculum sp. PtaB.Bin013]|nr:MAG: hypothetical protein A4E52_01340 [Pelotomaculum sp. PtaB.Bin013]